MHQPVINEALFNKPLRYIGMAKKAGLLAIGSEAVKAAARARQIKLVLTATDISTGSARQARYNAEDSKAIYVETPYTKFELGNIAGRGSPGTLAFLDLGFAAGFMKCLTALNKEKYEEPAELITKRMESQKAKRRTNI